MTLYLNHAGTSWPKPDAVNVAIREAMDAAPETWPGRFEAAHRTLADFFGVPNPEQLLLTPGCTSALSVAISDVFLEKGARILTSHWEHHAVNRPLLKRASTGNPLERIPAVGHPEGDRGDQEAMLDLGWLERELSRGDVGLLAITAACNVTGELLPYQDVIHLARRHEAMVLLDAAQLVGWSRLDLSDLGADLVAFGGHKGLQAPWGIGGLYVSDRARMSCISAQCELPGVTPEGAMMRPRPGYCDVGSVDQFALAGLQASVAELQHGDSASRLDVGRSQIRRFRETLSDRAEVRLFGVDDPDRSMPTVAFGLPGTSSAEIARRLSECDVIVGSGHHCAPVVHELLGTQSDGLVRLSVGVGQPDQDVDEAVDRLHVVLDSLS